MNRQQGFHVEKTEEAENAVMPPPMIDKLPMIVTVCLMVIVIGVWALIGINFRPGFTHIADGQTPLASYRHYDEGARPYTDAEQKGIAGDRIGVLGYTGHTMQANSKDVSILLLNGESNAVDFVFSLILADTEETLYTSGLVAPGWFLEDIQLTRGIPKGKHKVTLRIDEYAFDSQALLGSITMEFEIVTE